MCGSGTFSIEAAMIKSNIPAGFFRSFAFENWPGFRKENFYYLKKTIQENITYSKDPGIYASDLSPDITGGFAKNISNFEFGSSITISQADFFDIDPSGIPSGKGVVLLNPPYGIRLGDKRITSSFYRDIGKKLKSDFKGWRAGIILPTKAFAQTLGLNVQLKPFFHGGLDLSAAIGRI